MGFFKDHSTAALPNKVRIAGEVTFRRSVVANFKRGKSFDSLMVATPNRVAFV